MMRLKRNLRFQARKTHRYLGVFIGIQFFIWTLGGLYFSWNNMDDVHGKSLRKAVKETNTFNLNQINESVVSFKNLAISDSILSIELIENGVSPLLCIGYLKNNIKKLQLVDLKKQQVRSSITEPEAIQIVKTNLNSTDFKVKEVKYITQNDVSKHNEYREKPLPAYAVAIDDSENTTFYVATEIGKITSVRNGNWRRFDFLWMLHTMDYQGRDTITNWVLRAFSIVGMLTICSGFFLFGVTSPTIRMFFRKLKK
jgi:hypothetical protein